MFLGAARHLVTFFKQSSKASQALKSMQEGENKLELALDVATQLNSTYSMLERLCCLQTPVHQVLCNIDIVKSGSAAHLKLRDSHWTVIQTVVETFKPIKVNLMFTYGCILDDSKVKFNVY